MWPEPKDLAFVVAAFIAGLFSIIVSLNSKDAALTHIRESWLNTMKKDTARLMSLMRARSIMYMNMKIVLEERDDAKKQNSLNELKDADKEIKEITSSLLVTMSEFRELKHRLNIELNEENLHFSQLLKQINFYSKMVEKHLKERKDMRGEEDVELFQKITTKQIDKISRVSKKTYKEEWELIKKGEPSIRFWRRVSLAVILVLSTAYLGYVVCFSQAESVKNEIEITASTCVNHIEVKCYGSTTLQFLNS